MESMESMLAEASASFLFHRHHGFHMEWGHIHSGFHGINPNSMEILLEFQGNMVVKKNTNIKD
jgi:hypothetical protein